MDALHVAILFTVNALYAMKIASGSVEVWLEIQHIKAEELIS